MLTTNAHGDEGVFQVAGLTRGRSWITYREEWPKIQDDIDAGRPSPLGLIQTDDLDIGSNHQVLAYGYEKSGQKVKLYVYDPNEVDPRTNTPSEILYEFDCHGLLFQPCPSAKPDTESRIAL
jgi:hypothetical protein